MENSKLIIWLGFITLIFWSFWYFANYPQEFYGEAIQQRCDDERTAYCLGFENGYNWAWSQIRMDEALENAIDRK